MDARVRAVINLMSHLLADGPSIPLLARKVNLSAPRLRQLFRKETGCSPRQFLQSLRMQRAESLLESTQSHSRKEPADE
jgi:transcriptional regulator GlxA family with amidase domain